VVGGSPSPAPPLSATHVGAIVLNLDFSPASHLTGRSKVNFPGRFSAKQSAIFAVNLGCFLEPQMAPKFDCPNSFSAKNSPSRPLKSQPFHVVPLEI
jgi:hypothetical protein